MKLLTPDELESALDKAGISFTHPNYYVDRMYVVPTLDWIETDFSEDLRKLQESMGVLGYEQEVNDCDDFARMSAAFANARNRATSGHPKASLTVGEFWYTKDSGGAHAINVFVCDSDLKIAFYEPQTRRVITITDAEKESCYYVRF